MDSNRNGLEWREGRETRRSLYLRFLPRPIPLPLVGAVMGGAGGAFITPGGGSASGFRGCCGCCIGGRFIGFILPVPGVWGGNGAGAALPVPGAAGGSATDA